MKSIAAGPLSPRALYFVFCPLTRGENSAVFVRAKQNQGSSSSGNTRQRLLVDSQMSQWFGGCRGWFGGRRQHRTGTVGLPFSQEFLGITVSIVHPIDAHPRIPGKFLNLIATVTALSFDKLVDQWDYIVKGAHAASHAHGVKIIGLGTLCTSRWIQFWKARGSVFGDYS